MNVDWVLLGLSLAALGGAVVQRATGIGYALVAAPFYALMLGPFEGVLLANVTSLFMNGLVLVATWRNTRWQSVPLIVIPAMIGILPGAILVRTVDGGWLSIFVGCTVLAAIVLNARVVVPERLTGRRGLVVAGCVSGFMNVTAGIGGPPLAIFASASRWALISFIPTLQVCNLFSNSASLLMKGGSAASILHIGGATVGTIVGVAFGTILAKRIEEGAGFKLALAVSGVGALASVAKGYALVAHS